jgi:hypothetical protein
MEKTPQHPCVTDPAQQPKALASTEEGKENYICLAYLLELEYLVTAFVPSETACFASSPGRMSRTEVWISRDEIVDFLLYAASLEASVATRSKISGGGDRN